MLLLLLVVKAVAVDGEGCCWTSFRFTTTTGKTATTMDRIQHKTTEPQQVNNIDWFQHNHWQDIHNNGQNTAQDNRTSTGEHHKVVDTVDSKFLVKAVVVVGEVVGEGCCCGR